MTAIDVDHHPLTILLVEDDAVHAELVTRTMEGRRADVQIVHLSDGEAALSYLNDCGADRSSPEHILPALILLDLRLPKIDGSEFLQTVKNSPKLKHLPVVVLTTSDAEQDVRNAYDAHANGYVVKPDEFSRFSQLMEDISGFWLKWNHAPPLPRKPGDDD